MKGDIRLNSQITTKELFSSVPPHLAPLFSRCTYPWEILPLIKSFIVELQKELAGEYESYSEGVLIGKNVSVSPLSTIIGPCIIGDGCEIRPGAYIRGNVITGKNCVLGNSSEFKNCILLDKVQAPHYNYVGDSVLGYHAHLGAGAICSNLKSDGTNVCVKTSDGVFDTGLRKMGAILADGADIGSGSVLNPGTIIGKNTSVYPLTSVRGVIGENYIVKSADNIVKRQ